MKVEDFKKHKIQRTKGLSFDKVEKYRKDLAKDFSHRCCYCNIHESVLMGAFHIDHFIPRDAFRGKKDDLERAYDNLMWSCPKCNLSKSSKYVGNLLENDHIENLLFYNPVETDYNTIFYRNELGAIDSDDEKGRKMIQELKLYRPIHTLSWMIEKLESTYLLLEKAIEKEEDETKKIELKKARDKIANIHMKKIISFRAAYMSKYVDKSKAHR